MGIEPTLAAWECLYPMPATAWNRREYSNDDQAVGYSGEESGGQAGVPLDGSLMLQRPVLHSTSKS